MSKTLTKSYQLVGKGSNTAVGADTMYLELHAKYESYSTTTNTSKVIVKAVLNSRSGQTHDGSGRTLRITDNTTGKNSGDISISKGSSSSNKFPEGDYTLYEWSETITHNADGTKSIVDSATFKLKAWGITLSVTSDTLILPNIPRTSGITTAKGGYDVADNYMLITIDRKASSYTDTVSWTCSNLSETVQTKGSATKIMLCFDDNSYSNVTPPSGYTKKRSAYSNVDIMNKIPNSQSIDMTFVTSTYNGNTLIGTSPTTKFTFQVYKTPYVNNLSYLITDTLSQNLTGATNVAIKGISNVQVTNTPTKSLNDNSTIASYTFVASNMAGVTQTSNTYTFNGLLGSIIRSVATDSRNYSTSLSQGAIELDSSHFLDYATPSITTLTATRTEETSSTVNVSIEGTFWNNSFGNSTNAITLSKRLKIDDGSYGSWSTITPTISGNDFTYTGTVNVASTSTGTLEIKVVDSTNSEYTLTVSIPKGKSLFDIGENVLRVNNNLYVDGSMALGDSNSNNDILLNSKSIKNVLTPVTRTIGLDSNTNYTISSTYGHTLVKCDVDITNLNATNKLSYSSTNGYITIGSGVTHIKVSGNVMARGIQAALIGEIQKVGSNSTETVSCGYSTVTGTWNWTTIGLSSKIIQVASGDKIQLTIGSSATGTMVVAGGAGQMTYLNVEVID